MPLRAQALFEEMRAAGVAVDTRAWTILLTIWARSKLPERSATAATHSSR
jgi:hypothetical protein